MKPHGFDWKRYLDIHDRLSIPYEIWDRKKLLEKMPHFTDDSFYPPRRYDDPLNREITDDQYKAQVFLLARRIPTFPIPNSQKGIVDLYDVSDDWTPIYDSSDLKGFYLCVGTSGNQYKNGPAVGLLMAEIINWVRRFTKGIEVNAETLATQVIHAAGPGGHFMTQQHTLDYMRKEVWQPIQTGSTQH